MLPVECITGECDINFITAGGQDSLFHAAELRGVFDVFLIQNTYNARVTNLCPFAYIAGRILTQWMLTQAMLKASVALMKRWG
jgi:hypothetical protein